MVGKGFLIFLTICISIYSFHYNSYIGYYILLLLVVFVFIKIKKMGFILIFVITFFYFYRPVNEAMPKLDNNLLFKVEDKKTNYCIISYNQYKFLYYQNNLILQKNYVIQFSKLSINEIRGNGIENQFSFKEYLKTKRVIYEIKGNAVIISNDLQINRKIINFLLQSPSYSKEYLGMILFGYNEPDLQEFNNDLKNLSAIQLFVVSGFHINLLALIISTISKKIFKHDKEIITNIILLFYIYLLNFTIAALRAFLLRIAVIIKNKYKIPCSRLDILSFIGILFLLIEPLNLFNLSFILTFIVCFFLEFLGIIKNNVSKSKQKKLYIIIPFFAVLPLIITINGRIGMINIIMNYLLSPFVAVLYCLSLITIILPFLDLFYYMLMTGFSTVISKIESLNIYLMFPIFSELFYVIYYLLLFKYLINNSLKRKTFYISVTINLLLIYQYSNLISFPFIAFLDVGQGDCILIHGANNQYNILIDTGGSQYSDIANKKLIPYFQSKGIKELDAILITHDDFDHNGALSELQKNFSISKVYTQSLLNYKIKSILFYNLNINYPIDSDDNEKSMVLYFEFIGFKFLMMGDASIETEMRILTTFNKKIDVLKVGHHGSKTSTSNQLLSITKPSVAIISCGYKNSYGHPHQEVIQRLLDNKVKIYRSDYQGSIIIEKYFNKVYIKTVL